MAPNSFILPDFSDLFQDLPSKQPSIMSQSQVDKPGPIIVRPLPDIQTFIVFSANFVPSDTEKWVKFDDKLRKLSGTPPKDATQNTTVHLYISDPGYGSTNTTMHILVSDCEDHRGIVEMSQSYPFNESNESRCKVCDNIIPEELDKVHYNDPALFSDGTVNQFPLNNNNSGSSNFNNVASSDSLGLGISMPGLSNLNDFELQIPNTIDIGSYTPAVHPLKSTTSSVYSVSSATASCDNITQTVSSTVLKSDPNTELTESDIPILYAKLGVLFQYSVKNLIRSSTRHKRPSFIKAVTEPNNNANFWGIPYKNDIGKTKIKVLQSVRDVRAQESNETKYNNSLSHISHELDSIESNFQVLEKFILIVVENDIEIEYK
ncbi:6029_t:CDS:2 [Racocetra fulgida]|uniref:6029_t:CDS:1 n=1 Tax=Racocetra fulgida TaxID=60492 RepID=A0A9N9I9D0_9GLOM|nr:6029_t:CDS:2 [Racocetra fulgida]